MKKYAKKLTAGFIAFAMVVSSMTPTAMVVSAAPEDSAESAAASDEITLSVTAETNLASARIISSLTEDEESSTADYSGLKAAIKDAIFNGYNDTTDLSRYNVSEEEVTATTEEVLAETNMASAVDVTYETDSDGTVTTAEVEMDPMVAMAAEELEENATVYNLTEEQSQQLLGMYAQYLQLYEDNADMFGVQVPYNTTRDTNSSPIGSLLDVASIPEEYAQAGYIGYDVLSGIIQLYYLGTQFAVSEYKDEVIAGRNEALSVLKDGMTEMQEYLAINDWLANNCQFAMDYIMDEMVEPEPAENKLYTYAYNCAYNMIKTQVHDAAKDALLNYGFDEDTAEAQANAQAEAFMVDVDEENGSGEQQAASLASSIVGMWGSNQVGVFVNKKAVCFGYADVYAYLLQCAHPEIYLKDGATDLDDASNWKSYTELNYEMDDEGNPVKDEDGNYKWSENCAAIADYVKIIFDANVTMFGEEAPFGEAHYWNAVKLDGNWYYVDPCYVDIYVECMNRDRVETDGNVNHLYFMFSDTSCREMYEDNFKEIRTLYEGIATDQTYEEAWVAFVKSQPYWVGDKIYYLYDSTDLLEIMREYDDDGTGSGSRAADNDFSMDFEGLFTDTEYKIVYHDNKSMDDGSESYASLIDFNNGQVYNPTSGELEDNALIAELYEEHENYVVEYPSISISCAYYDGKIYFSLSNCVLSYDLETGEVVKLIEYTEVSGKRDMSNGLGGLAFTMTNEDPGTNGITVQNPPIADMTIKDDGKMYVSVATNYAFISGKKFGKLTDYSSYGYQFAETNYEPSYNSYYNSDEENDNDEFMWSANIVGTIDMDHLTGTSHSNETVTIPASCTEDEYEVTRCTECGKIEAETTVENEAETTNEGEDDENTDGEEIDPKDVATLSITIKDGEGGDANIVGTDTLTHVREKKEEGTGEADEPEAIDETDDTVETEETSYTFTEAEITEKVKGITLTAGYVLSDSNSYKAETVEYGASKEVSYFAEKETAYATLKIEVQAVVEDGKVITVGSTTMSSTDEGKKGDPYTFSGKDIQTTVEGLTLEEGYVLAENKFEDVEVAYGSTGDKTYDAEKQIAELPAVLNITIQAGEGENVLTVGSDTMTANGPEGETATFTAAEIQAKVEAIELTDGYILADNVYSEETVAYGASKDLTFYAQEKNQPATLVISVVIGEGDQAQEVASDSLSKVGEVGSSYTFPAADIQAKAESIELPENYELAAFDYQDETVPYGESKTITLTAVITQAKASVVITVYDSATMDDDDTDPTVLVETPLEEVGDKGTTKEYSVEDIKNAVAEELEAMRYTLDEDSLPKEAVTATYGGESVPVELTATEIPTGTGHRYITFNETYYTKVDKEDANSAWNTGTSYVCIDCGHAFELDEDDETIEDNLRSNDVLLTDEEVAAYAENLTEVWTWSTDGTEASLYLVPTELMDHRFDCVWENESLSKRGLATVTGDCETGEFKATVTLNGKEYTGTKTLDAHNHSYLNQEETDDEGNVTQEAAVQWTWADDYSSAEVSFTCDVCGKTRTEKVSGDAIEKSSSEPTCTEAGSNTYKATVTVDEVNYISSRTEETDPATGHNYGDDEPVWTWGEQAEDGSYNSATATFTCTVCGEEVTEEAVITKEIDREAGKTIFTATVTVNDKEYTDTKEVDKIIDSENPFVDVNEDDYFYDAVLWAVKKGITTGYDESHFVPLDNCTRAQVVTFLWRTVGKPDVETDENPFVDISEDDYYYTAVLWAYENGITKGMDETHFAPNENVTRGQFVTFMYREKGEPEYSVENPFEDVKEDEYYTDAVLWAYENGITTGTDATHFAPEDNSTRGDVVTFLYRGYAEE
ncbi:MAG: S-layer homology domain-containing protein [Fusicatenibacter sp.]|nr:S-layer homology domain-containing protein [Fusicatenibacter sp.]